MAVPGAFAEGRITKLRREAKLALAPAEAAALRARLAAAVGDPAVSRVVSVYFDRPGWPLAARAAAAPHDTVKLRFKEYFPDRGGSGSDRVVLELKREANGVTRKERVWVPRQGLEAALRDPGVTALRAWIGEKPLLPAEAEGYMPPDHRGEVTGRVTDASDGESFYVDPRRMQSLEPPSAAFFSAPH